MSPRSAMIYIMANVIGASDAYDGEKLNDPAVWEQFLQTVLEQMETCPDQEMQPLLESIDRERFQQWIDAPGFWEDLNQELERRAQVLMTLLPSENQGNC